jgi:cyclopropane fatty-acyl-phospholipid synthase-like methyltransferase
MSDPKELPVPDTDPTCAADPTVAADPTARRVVTCYSLFDAFMTRCGFTDLTDGMYEGDPTRPYEVAQTRQAEVLLDRARVGSVCRLLEIGCGYGRLLRAARDRGARAWGITVSPEQVRRTAAAGLNVRLQNYKHLGPEWDGQFDAVVANGSLEHFAQPEDAAVGRDDAIYRHLFDTVRRLLDPETLGARFVTTAIHFRRRPDPRALLGPPAGLSPVSEVFHFARVLSQGFGGWYPVPGQLERCAEGYFRLIDEEDGTEDYRLTSEACLAASRRRMHSLRGLVIWLRAVPLMLRHPVQTAGLYRCIFGSESWNWQFRGEAPPTVLLRQTWERIG